MRVLRGAATRDRSPAPLDIRSLPVASPTPVSTQPRYDRHKRTPQQPSQRRDRISLVGEEAVVERRQRIGVLRAIGFRRRMVQLSFMLESSFIALTAIVVGTGSGWQSRSTWSTSTRASLRWETSASVCPG